MASEVLLDPYDIKSWSPLDSTSGGKKTWEELRKSVRDTMKLLTSLAGSVPTSFTFHSAANPTSGKLSRLYFLGIPSKGRENTLLYADIIEDEHDKFVLPWKPLIDTLQPSWSSGQLSKEEQLMRERKRLGSYGITSYDFAEEGGRFVFPANSGLYVCEVTDLTSDIPLVPTLIETQCTGARLDPKICPSNPEIVAFINSGDIWVSSVTTYEELQLTHTQNTRGGGLEDNPITAGSPSFVVQEEFDRYTGYWWQPNTDTLTSEGNQTLRILYEQVDESCVDILHIFGSSGLNESGVDEYRYPRAGTANAQSSLRLVEFQVNTFGPVRDSEVHKHLVEPLSAYCSWAEYLVRAGWTPDGKFAYAQLMDRRQLRLCLLLIPVECFVVEDDMDMYSFDPSKYPPVQCVYEETSDIWVNVHDVLHFFPQTFENQISFLWSSQKSGYRHLYHVTSRLTESAESPVEVEMEEKPAGKRLKQEAFFLPSRTQCESGNFVLCKVKIVQALQPIWVDERQALVYFIACKDSPLENHLYVVSYANPAEPPATHGAWVQSHGGTQLGLHDVCDDVFFS
ncbi:hypothetical protein BaRGS_00037331 [Batillaria attramentaria]|uniref:Uncharacterized protein n=1 Tax=Batillaria attramentaria TaxID=370345 RepID=A0ABD0J928_9CAEN